LCDVRGTVSGAVLKFLTYLHTTDLPKLRKAYRLHHFGCPFHVRKKVKYLSIAPLSLHGDSQRLSGVLKEVEQRGRANTSRCERNAFSNAPVAWRLLNYSFKSSRKFKRKFKRKFVDLSPRIEDIRPKDVRSFFVDL
jgi:hypothetical protein